MSDAAVWLVTLNAFWFPFGIHISSTSSGDVYGLVVTIGFFAGVISFAVSLFGTGSRKLITAAIAALETALWFFMSVGA